MKKVKTVLVCVTGQRDCDRLIRIGKRTAAEQSASLKVLCVQPASAGFDTDCEELEYLRQTARDAGAEMSVYFNNDAPLMAAGVAKQIRAVHIVTGMAENSANGFIEVLHGLLPAVPISMVAKSGTIYNICPAEKNGQSTKAVVTQA